MRDCLVNDNDLRSLCIRKQWFTAGDVRQYDKLFEMNRTGGAGLRDLAVIIWVCSSNCSLEEVSFELKKLFAQY